MRLITRLVVITSCAVVSSQTPSGSADGTATDNIIGFANSTTIVIGSVTGNVTGDVTENVSGNVAGNVTALLPESPFSLAANFVLNQEQLCEHFKLTAKPYYMIFGMFFANLICTLVLFVCADSSSSEKSLTWSTNPATFLASTMKLGYLAYQFFSGVWAAIELAHLVNVTDYPSIIAGSLMPPPTAWDKYQLYYYLMAQSCVTSTMMSLYMAYWISHVIWAMEEGAGRIYAFQEFSGSLTCCKISQRGFVNMSLGASVVLSLFFLPALITHVIPMVFLYLYLWLLPVCTVCCCVCFVGAVVLADGLNQTTNDSWSRRMGLGKHATLSPRALLPPLISIYVIGVLTFQTSITYGVLLYGRGIQHYADGIVDEWSVRKISSYLECLGYGELLTKLDFTRSWV